MTVRATDWDAYYRRPAAPTVVTRKVSERKLLNVLHDHLRPNTAICECGGANSCFIDAFLVSRNVSRYHVVDFNAYGVSLLAQKHADDKRVSWEVANLLDQDEAWQPQFDVVYSVGLIEHFGVEGTRTCVKAHFDLCKPGGVVLLTFPTPTLLYRLIRSLAEATSQWAFPDERPLEFSEVVQAASPFAERRLHRSINWAIGLTQGYLMFQKN